jgi:hypothetical protein
MVIREADASPPPRASATRPHPQFDRSRGAPHRPTSDDRRVHPSELPLQLPPAFTVREALEAGVSKGRLRARDLQRPFHGTRSRAQLDPIPRLRLLLRVLPDGAFVCGPTAAAVRGMPLPARVERDAVDLPIIGVPYPRNRIRRRGVRGRSLRVAESEIEEYRGIRLTTPARTWRDVSADLGLPAMVAVTDFLIGRRRPLCTVDELAAQHAAAPTYPGAQRRVKALELCSTASESPRESELRTALMLAGLPTPECNVDIFDGRRFVARVDLLYRAQKLVVEYYGDHHRDPNQWSVDEMRRAELESLGYRVTVVTRRDFDDLAALAARIRRLLSA